MRTNGKIKYQSLPTPQFDEHGSPIIEKGIANSSWSDAIPCSIKTNSHSNKGKYQDGKFTIASYEVLIELADLKATRVQLERDGENLGEFDVQDVQLVKGMGRTKIVV